MEEEIFKAMNKREKIGQTNLEFGDIVLIKNYKSSALDLRTQGPAIFLEYNNNEKMSAMVYNTNTKRTHRCSVTNLAPF